MKFIIVLLIVAFTITSMATVIVNNAGKPIRNLKTLLFGDRLAHYKFQGGYLVKVVSFVNDYVPENATLGLAIGLSWEYPFFGENFTRELIPIYPLSNFYDKDWVSDHGIEFILVDQSQFEDYYLPEYCTEIGSFDEYIILHVNQ